MKTEFILLALYEKMFLNFKETCEAIGIPLQTGYNLRNRNEFPIPTLEHPIRASIKDISEYIDQQAELTRDKKNGSHQ